VKGKKEGQLPAKGVAAAHNDNNNNSR